MLRTLKNLIVTTALLGLVTILWVNLKPGGFIKPGSARDLRALANRAQKSPVRNFDVKVQNLTLLGDKQLSTVVQSSGLFHVLNDSMFSLNLNDVSGSISGQGNEVPNWNLLRQGSAIVKFENDKLWLAWKGESLGDLEFNALRILVGSIPPIQRFVGNSTIAYEMEDLYSSGKWIWMASNLASDKIKWSASYVGNSKKQDDFLKRNLNWQILNDHDVWDVTGHDVMELSLVQSQGLTIDVTTELHFKAITNEGFNLGIYESLSFVPLSEGRSRQDSKSRGGSAPSDAENQLTKAEWIEDFKTKAKIDYLSLKKSLDQGDWQVDDIKALLADLRVTKVSLNNLLGALSQTKWKGGKEILLGYLTENWKNETRMVNYIPLLAQGLSANSEVDSWLKDAAKSHPSAEVRTTALLARGTLANLSKKDDEAKSQIIFDDLLAELSATKDPMKIENLLAALGNAGGENLSLKFTPWLSHAEPAVRAQAYFSLRNDAAQDQAFETLLNGLSDRNRLVRLRSAQAVTSMTVSSEKLTGLKPLYDKEVDKQVKMAISEVLDRL